MMVQISHEIRNPLSAVLHCTEDIVEMVNAGAGSSRQSTVSKDLMVEAAETIFLCVNHQRSIVDGMYYHPNVSTLFGA